MNLRFNSLLMFLFITLLSTISYSQFSSLGIKGGLILSKLNYLSDLKGYDFSFRNGINVGIFTEYSLSNYFSICTELNYSNRGTEYSAEDKRINGIIVPNHKFIQKHVYFEIPLILKYIIQTDYELKPHVFFGAEYSFLLNAKIEYVENDKSYGEVDEKNHLKSSEYGILLGAGVEYPILIGRILFDFRYVHGLKNINILVKGSEIKSRSISFNVGYIFSL